MTATGCETRGQLSLCDARIGSRLQTYADGDILGCGKEPIDEDSHERRVKTILDGELSQLSISHTLGNNNSTNSGTLAMLVTC